MLLSQMLDSWVSEEVMNIEPSIGRGVGTYPRSRQRWPSMAISNREKMMGRQEDSRNSRRATGGTNSTEK